VGLGNIYVDESLFLAGIHPETPAGKLTKKQVVRLQESIVATLSEAVEQGGSSIKSYVNGQGEMGCSSSLSKYTDARMSPVSNAVRRLSDLSLEAGARIFVLFARNSK
jgi:formamidopyrimidine-DNA glycosylase